MAMCPFQNGKQCPETAAGTEGCFVWDTVCPIKTVGNASYLEIARGNVAGMAHINKFGRNPNCHQAASATAVNLGRTIWGGGIDGAVNWVAPTTVRTHQVKSTSTNDTSAGTGARTVRIFGLDSAFALQQEDVTLNGTTNVGTANTYTMIYRKQVLTAGSLGYNDGAITATADSDNTVTAQMTAKTNQTLMAIYQIPAAKKGYMLGYSASLHKKGGAGVFADISLMSMETGGVWRVRDNLALASDGSTHGPRVFEPPKVFQAKELIQVIANPSADAQDISAEFNLIVVDN